MIFLISIGFVVTGLIFKKYYHNGIFNNSIYKPILVLGGLMFVISIVYEVSTLHSIQIYELNEEQIQEVKVTRSYDYPIEIPTIILAGDERIAIILESFEEKLLWKQGCSNIIGYIEIQVSLTNGENLYAELYKTKNGYFFNQSHKFLFMYLPNETYLVSDKIGIAF